MSKEWALTGIELGVSAIVVANQGDEGALPCTLETGSAVSQYCLNFLAHLHIASETHTSFAGALAADFVRGPVDSWPASMAQGMRLHRFVDGWIDGHATTLSLRSRFDPAHRRVAGILLDLAFDHQLARRWHTFSPLPLQHFTRFSYRQVAAETPLPPGLAKILPRMAQDDWILHYQHREGIEGALNGIARRLSRPAMITSAIPEIWRLEEDIAQAFEQVYPQLLDACQRWVAVNQLPPPGTTR